MKIDEILAAQLEALDSANLRRRLRMSDASLVDFALNDYLGLRRHPALIEAACRATQRDGAGAGASRLISGTDAAVLALEAVVAEWKGQEAALLFNSGYAAAVGTIPALVGKGDVVVLDKLAHASLIDGARLSGATVRTFPHNRTDRLETLLKTLSSGSGRILVVTESIFSMDGDEAPLAEIVALKDRYGAWLLVDEAHATGLYGPTGAGLLAQRGLTARVEITLGTLSKALGSIGGVITGSRTLIDWLLNRARSFIYSTALPPGAVAASRAALELVRGEEGVIRRERLQENIELYRSRLPGGWKQGGSTSGAIQPLPCGDSSRALELAQALREKGFFIPAIRYPTVPRHAARLRVTISASHTPKEIGALHAALASLEPGVSSGIQTE